MKKVTLVQFQYGSRTFPLSAVYLTSALHSEGIAHTLKIFPQLSTLKVDSRKLYSFLVDSGDILAIGCLSHMLPYLVIALEKIKKRFPHKVIILGGIGPTEAAEGLMHTFSCIDFIIKGCGIRALPALIKKIIRKEEQFSDLDRLVYREGGVVKSTAYDGFYSREIVHTIPDRHLMKKVRHIRTFDLMTSFGCLYRCTYCYLGPLSGGRVTYRNLDDVMEEILIIKSIKKNNDFGLNITDEAFILNKERVLLFCDMLRRKKLKIRWGCYGRVDRMDIKLIKTIVAHGCRSLYYGIESGSNRILRETKKGFTSEEAQKVALLSKKFVKNVVVSFIYLYPFETVEDFYQTFALKKYLESHGIDTQLHKLTPVRNSAIYLQYKDRLVLTDKAPSTLHGEIKEMPAQCLKLVRNNPDIFYFYYTYQFDNFDAIIKAYNKFKPYYNQIVASRSRRPQKSFPH